MGIEDNGDFVEFRSGEFVLGALEAVPRRLKRPIFMRAERAPICP